MGEKEKLSLDRRYKASFSDPDYYCGNAMYWLASVRPWGYWDGFRPVVVEGGVLDRQHEHLLRIQLKSKFLGLCQDPLHQNNMGPSDVCFTKPPR